MKALSVILEIMLSDTSKASAACLCIFVCALCKLAELCCLAIKLFLSLDIYYITKEILFTLYRTKYNVVWLVTLIVLYKYIICCTSI